jgi:CRISPR-associated protein Csb2
LGEGATTALEWLACLSAPTIVCPIRVIGTAYRSAVPNNDFDVIARRQAKGLSPDKQPSELKTLKTIRPARLVGGEEYPVIHHLYPLADSGYATHLGTLQSAARSVTHLGWGVDIAAGDAAVVTQEQANALTGERWRPVGGAGSTTLRVPRPGTLAALIERHQKFLGRLPEGGGFAPVLPLTVFDTVGYRCDTAPDTAPRAVAAFELRTPDLARFQPYDTARRTAAVAGMVRNATARLAETTHAFGWSDAQRLAAVHGHTPDGKDQLRGDGAGERFAFLPLPSIEKRPMGEVVGGVRRVLVVAPPGLPAAARWARVLSGEELTPERDDDACPAALQLIEPPESDWVVNRYLVPERVWTTVTPVLRPGFDDRDSAKAEGLLRKAFEQAGFPPGLVKDAKFEWRAVGFRAGVEHVQRFELPETLKKFARFHVRVTWPVSVAGPIAVGAGRYRGFGVFVAESG